MNHRNSLVALAVIAAVTTSLGTASRAATPLPIQKPRAVEASVLVIAPEDDGKTMTLGGVDAVSIQLPGNPTTGYSWTISRLEGRALGQGEITYQRSETGHLIGGGGTFTARFLVVEAGKAKIVLTYLRPWEKDRPPLKTFTVTIDVMNPPGTQPSTAPAR